MAFDEKKVTALIYLIFEEMGEKSIPYRKLMKMLYLCDRSMYSTHKKFITNDAYSSMSNGPVLMNTDVLISLSEKEGVFHFKKYFTKKGDNLVRNSGEIDISNHLSPKEIKMTQYNVAIFTDSTEEQIIEFTHTFCPEWKNPAKDDIAISSLTEKDIEDGIKNWYGE